jgi:hypothetical protein
VPGKRQHYVPKFLIRRFAIDPSDKKSLIFKLEKNSGKPSRVNPLNELVIGHYYRIVLGDGTVMNEADIALDHIETMAAEVVVKLPTPAYTVTTDDALRLTLFVLSLRNRTPRAREALREVDERAAELDLEVRLSDREQYHKFMGKGRSEADVEAERVGWLEDLRAGRLGIESTPEREVALMLMALPEATETLLATMGWRCMRIPLDSKAAFVLSDHPVAHYDPTPKTPEAGASFASSRNSQTWLALDPTFGLLLSQQHPGTWDNIEIDDETVDELNLLTYAWAAEAIYGPSQEAVTRVRRTAKRKPALLGEFRYRPPRVWVARGGPEGGGPHDFTSRFKGQTVTRKLYVSQEGMAKARRAAALGADEPGTSVDEP